MRQRKQLGPKPSERRRAFQLAYAAEVLKEQPCAWCGDPRPTCGTAWTPNLATLRAHGLDNGKPHTYVIRLCNACLIRGYADPTFVTAVEDKILAEAVAGQSIKVECS